MRFRTIILLALILIAGAVLRISYNDIDEYSPDDEKVYVDTTVHLHQHGWWSYQELTRNYVKNPEAWIYPHPMRWGYFALTNASCHVTDHCDARALADLSTLAGIAAILLTFLLGRALFGDEVGIIAAAITVTSPLQWAIGRRALQDEVFCASFVLTMWLAVVFVRATGTARRRWLLGAAAVAGATLTMGIKESTLMYYPAFFLFLIFAAPVPRKRSFLRIAALAALPPVLNAVVMAILCRGVKDYVAILRIIGTVASSANSEWAMQYQSGPIHRPLFDLLLLAPVTIILAIGGAARSERKPAVYALTAFAVVALFTFGVMTLKNARYVIPVDPVARLLAASWIAAMPRRPWLALLFITAIVASEWWIFQQVFVIGDIFDPLTYNILYALHAIPGASP